MERVHDGPPDGAHDHANSDGCDRQIQEAADRRCLCRIDREQCSQCRIELADPQECRRPWHEVGNQRAEVGVRDTLHWAWERIARNRQRRLRSEAKTTLLKANQLAPPRDGLTRLLILPNVYALCHLPPVGMESDMHKYEMDLDTISETYEWYVSFSRCRIAAQDHANKTHLPREYYANLYQCMNPVEFTAFWLGLPPRSRSQHRRIWQDADVFLRSGRHPKDLPLIEELSFNNTSRQNDTPASQIYTLYVEYQRRLHAHEEQILGRLLPAERVSASHYVMTNSEFRCYLRGLTLADRHHFLTIWRKRFRERLDHAFRDPDINDLRHREFGFSDEIHDRITAIGYCFPE